MDARFIADAIVVFHFAFIAFVVAGGGLALWRREAALVHLPALAWGLWTEFTGAICPLTPLENSFREAAGEVGVSGSFVEHYLVPVIYPAALTSAHAGGFRAVSCWRSTPESMRSSGGRGADGARVGARSTRRR